MHLPVLHAITECFKADLQNKYRSQKLEAMHVLNALERSGCSPE